MLIYSSMVSRLLLSGLRSWAESFYGNVCVHPVKVCVRGVGRNRRADLAIKRNTLRDEPAGCHDLCMTDIVGSISNFFARHRAHCAEHEVYQPGCPACVSANDNGYVAGWSVAGGELSGRDDSASVDTSGSDTSSADVSDTSDFGGFDGGDSGGGGASGDF